MTKGPRGRPSKGYASLRRDRVRGQVLPGVRVRSKITLGGFPGGLVLLAHSRPSFGGRSPPTSDGDLRDRSRKFYLCDQKVPHPTYSRVKQPACSASGPRPSKDPGGSDPTPPLFTVLNFLAKTRVEVNIRANQIDKMLSRFFTNILRTLLLI